MHGKLTVAGNPGHGSTFRFAVVLDAAAEAAASGAGARANGHIAAKSLRVLCA